MAAVGSKYTSVITPPVPVQKEAGLAGPQQWLRDLIPEEGSQELRRDSAETKGDYKPDSCPL